MEKAEFIVCESDGSEGLTWAEVEICEVRFNEKYQAFPIIIYFKATYANSPLYASFGDAPTNADFQNFDLNNDGTLMFEEWEEKTNCTGP